MIKFRRYGGPLVQSEAQRKQRELSWKSARLRAIWWSVGTLISDKLSVDDIRVQIDEELRTCGLEPESERRDRERKEWANANDTK